MKPDVITSHVILEGVINVRRDRLLYKNEHEQDYYVIKSSAESAVIVAESDDGKILITHEYRHAIGKFVYGLPGGLVDEGELPLTAAKRELLEETGCTAKSYEIIGTCYPLPGILAQKMTIVHAKGATLTHTPTLEPSETIHSTFMTRQELKALFQSNNDFDATLSSALFFFNK